MPRQGFDADLRHLQDEIINLGSEVETNLVRAAVALKDNDQETASALIKADEHINAKRIEIGMDALRLIATQQPFAGDMRLLAAIIEIVGELERIHDYVKGIGKITLMLDPTIPLAPVVVRIPEMATIAAAMLHQALDAFVKRDVALARGVPAMDDAVDKLFNDIYDAILRHVAEDPLRLNSANRVEWVVHNLERAADRVLNICEWIVYVVTGTYEEFDSEFEAPPD
jgi:phosphate transport system protein